MAVPKKKTSKSRRDMRRSHHSLSKPTSYHSCPQCSEEVRMHHVCTACGYYKDKEVIEVPLDL